MMPTTTIVRDSQIGDDWVRQAVAANPVQPVLDAQGQPTGNFLTGPVRLAFTDAVFEKRRNMESDPNSKEGYGVTVLFTPLTDMTLLWQEYCRIAAASFAQHYNPQTGQYVGLVPPWRDQGEKIQFGGYTTGAPFMNLKSGYAPAVVDARMNPIVDRSQIYAGCWAIVAVSCFAGGIGKPKKGPMFGLQSIMKIADDSNLAGAAPDPRQLFGAAKVTPPAAVPGAGFGAPQQPPQFGAPAVAQVYGQPGPAPSYTPPQPGPAPAAPADEVFDMSKFL